MILVSILTEIIKNLSCKSHVLCHVFYTLFFAQYHQMVVAQYKHIFIQKGIVEKWAEKYNKKIYQI